MTFFFQPNTIVVILKKISSSKLDNWSEWYLRFGRTKKSASIYHKRNPYGSKGLIKAF